MMNKHAFILTLEIVLGSTLVFALIFASLFFLNRGTSGVADSQLLLFGSDVITLLDNQNIFDSLDTTTIETAMQEVVPRNYALVMQLQGNLSQGNGTIEVGDEIPEKEAALVGRKAVLTENNTYIQITYWVGTRGE